MGDPVELGTLLQEQSKESRAVHIRDLVSTKIPAFGGTFLDNDKKDLLKINIDRDINQAIEDYAKTHPKEIHLGNWGQWELGMGTGDSAYFLTKIR